MVGKFLCFVRGHLIDRKRVWHDGLDPRATCRRCSQPMIRITSGWSAFDSNRDASTRRGPHPRAH